jgi:7-cyano-7-deazaguanine tRNA-ribosyltransferase
LSFETREKALLGRVGRLRTKSGTIETPLLFPVVNPTVQLVSPRKIREEFGFEALITNAYILKKHAQNQPAPNGLHDFLDFKGIVMTDSGAYQILVYGDVEVTPKEIVEYQETIGPDIATILDIPTGWKVTKNDASKTVNETLKRARDFFKQRTRDDIVWVGPVQGGRYLDLVAKSANVMGRLPFEINALGSPTEVMERYRFDVLVDMIMAAKMNLPAERPLHLFGAGHPFMFAMAVALGCDFFDSAAYTLFAKENRYMTETGTARLSELEYFPCACPRCTRATPKEASEMTSTERQVFLAEHNLYVCAAEMKRVKQAIKDGRLWEHLEMRAHGHPSLLQAAKRLRRYEDFIEKNDPVAKKRGLFFFSYVDLTRPEVVRHRKRLAERYIPPKASVLLLVPQTRMKPFHKSRDFKKFESQLSDKLGAKQRQIHMCFYAAPFGVIPHELDEIYPLSQYETVLPPDAETATYVADQVAEYIAHYDYNMIILLNDSENWGKSILKASKKTCLKKKVDFQCFNTDKKQEIALETLLRKFLRTN